MKILDRYVLWTFLKNYLISFIVLVGMYVVLDMVFNFDSLANFKNAPEEMQGNRLALLYKIADRYFYQVFLFFVYLSGMIPVVAAAFTLMRLSRFNELTAVLAAGVPLLRVAFPIVVAGVVLNGLLIVDQELIIPPMIPKLLRDHDDFADANTKSFEIRAMQDNNLGLLRAIRYIPGTGQEPPTMLTVDITERREVDLPVKSASRPAGPDNAVTTRRVPAATAHITADKAVWNSAQERWDLTNGVRMSGLGADDMESKAEPIASYKSNITPEEISLYRSGNSVELLSTNKIEELLDRPGSYGVTHLRQVKHWRFVQPIMNIILLLLAIPCVLTREPGKLKSAATKCLILTGLGMGAIFLSRQIAGTPSPYPDWAEQWPAFVAWTPIFVFVPLTYLLLERVKT